MNLKLITVASNQGLPSDQVHAIAQDKENRIWLASPAGLSRYDGSLISIFDNQNGLICQGLRTVSVNKDIVWIGTDQGLETLHTNGDATNILFDQEWTHGLVESIAFDSKTVWLGSANGLLKLDYDPFEKKANVSLIANVGFVRDIIILEENLIIAVSTVGLIICDGKQWKLMKQNSIPKEAVSLCISKASRKRILVGTDHGLYVLDKDGNLLNHIQPLGKTQKVSAIAITQNEWWLGVGSNVLLYKEDSDGIQYSTKYQIGSNVNDLFVDKVNNIWVGSNSSGLKKISCLRNVFTKINTGAQGAVYSIRKTIDNKLRIGGETYCSLISKKELSTPSEYELMSSLPEMTVWDSCADPTDPEKIWLATQEGLFFFKENKFEQFGKADQVLKSPSRCLLPVGSEIYVGTLSGLSKISGTKVEEIFGNENVNLGYVYSIEMDENSNLWIATLGKGLWHKTKDGVTQITGDSLYAIGNTYAAVPNMNGDVIVIQDERIVHLNKNLEDRLVLSEYPVGGWSAKWLDTTHIIIGSNDGLLSIDLDENKIIKRINPLLGKGGWQFTNTRSLYVESAERIYCGLNAGLFVLNLSGFSEFSKIPDLFLDTVKWENSTPKFEAKVNYSLKPGKWSMETSVHSSWFVSEELVSLRFKLVGFDENWTALKKSPKIKFTSLPPGKYELKGQVYTPLTGFGEQTSLLNITVLSPWWTSVIFRPLEWITKYLIDYVKSRSQNKKLIERNIELENEIAVRKLAETEKKTLLDLFTKIAANIPGAIFQYKLKPDGQVSVPFASDGIKDLYAVTPEEIKNDATAIVQRVHPDDVEWVLKSIQESAENLSQWNVENRVVLPSGKTIWVESHSTPQKMEDGSILWHGFQSDITSRKDSAKELESKSELIETLIQTIPDLIWLKDINGLYLKCNKEFERLFGAKESEIIGKTDYDFVDKKLADFFRKNDLIAAEAQKPTSNEEYLIFADGSYEGWFETTKTPMFDNNRNIIGVLGIARDITQRKKAEEEIRRMSLAVHQSTSVIVITDTQGKIEYANPKFTEITGYTSAEVIGKNPKILKSGDKSKEEYKILWDTIISGKVWTGEFLNKKKNGELYIESASIFPLKNNFGEITNYVAIKEDIGERKKTEKELHNYRENLEQIVEERTRELNIKSEELEKNQLGLMNLVDDLNKQSQELTKEKDRAESADRLKSAFLATMSHELRTPLNSIIGFTGILLKEYAGPLNDEQRKQLSMAKGSAHHLLQLINDVLDISKIEAGELVVSFSPFNFSSLLKKVISSIQPLADKKDLEIQAYISAGVQEIISDSRRVEQIFINLLTNAIKFTIDGSVTVKSERINNAIVTKITDTGIGIDEKDIDKLFKPFSQIDTGTTRMHEGTGLGLSITKRLLDKLGGDIRVESKIGVGSTFTVKLPISNEKEIISS